MLLDIVNEIQNTRPWDGAHEPRRIMRAVEQAKLADQLGDGCWWQVESHGGAEFSLSSAPEILLAAISQQIRRIRLGHSAVLADLAGGGLTGEFLRREQAAMAAPNEAQLVIGRVLQGEEVPDQQIFDVLSQQASLIVGSQETRLRKLRALCGAAHRPDEVLPSGRRAGR